MRTENSNGRRLMRVQISQQLVEEFLRTGHEIARPVRCIEGLPVGARLVHARSLDDEFVLYDRRDVELTFEHESFAEVEPGAEPPFLTPIYEYVDAAAQPPTLFGLPIVESDALNDIEPPVLGTYCTRSRGCVKADGHDGDCWPSAASQSRSQP